MALDHICINRKPSANFFKQIGHVIRKRPSLSFLLDRLKNTGKIGSIVDEFCKEIGVRKKDLKAEFNFVEHHRAHIASGFLVSPFEESALISVDGFGDFLSCMMATGKGNEIEILNTVLYSPFPGNVLFVHHTVSGFP